MIVFYCSKRSPTNSAWWACSLAKGHAGACVFDRKDKSKKDKVMTDTQKLKKKYKIKDDLTNVVVKTIEEVTRGKDEAIRELTDKCKTIALKLFDVEAENKKLKDEILAAKDWRDAAKEEAGFDRNVSFDVVWAAALKAYRNGGMGWTPVADTLPPEARGPGHCAGWTAWLECINGEYTDSGLVVFTASYSHELGRWQDINQQRRMVTHYRVLPTKESL